LIAIKDHRKASGDHRCDDHGDADMKRSRTAARTGEHREADLDAAEPPMRRRIDVRRERTRA
jgi:hypothetical protein